jgi:hypothetical protein
MSKVGILTIVSFCLMLSSCVTTSTDGAKRTADTRVSKSDYIGTYRLGRGNWNTAVFWAELSKPPYGYSIDTFDSFRLDWQGDDLSIEALRNSRTIATALHRSGEDFSWRKGTLVYSKETTSGGSPYYPGIGGPGSTESTVFLDEDRNLVIHEKDIGTGLFVWALPNVHLHQNYKTYQRISAPH